MIPTQSRFTVLVDGVQAVPSIILVVDSPVRHRDKEFCAKGTMRKILCFPGAKIKDALGKVLTVMNTYEETTFTDQEGTNRARSEKTISKYKDFISKFSDSCIRITA